MLAGDLDCQDFKRLPHEDEAVVLRTLLETFISRACVDIYGTPTAFALPFVSVIDNESRELLAAHLPLIVGRAGDGVVYWPDA